MNFHLTIPTLVFLGVTGGGLIVGFGILGVSAHRRNRLVHEFQAALKIFANTFREGRTFQDAVQVLADLAPRPLNGEFRHLRQQLARGRDQAAVLETLFQRIPCFEARFLAAAVSHYGEDSTRLYSALIRLDSLKHRRVIAHQQVTSLNRFARCGIRTALLSVPFLFTIGAFLPTNDLQLSIMEMASKPIFGFVFGGIFLALAWWVLILQTQDEAEIVLD